MTLREKLIELRTEAKLTQENLAKKLCISTSSIKKYENEKNPRTPEIHFLKIYSEYFNVSMGYLTDDNIKNKPSENININKILKLSDKAIDSLKNNDHKAIDLFIESSQFSTFNNLLDLYFKFSHLIRKTEQLKIEDKFTIDELAQSINEIMNVYNSYCTENSLITLYTPAIENLDGTYSLALGDNEDIDFVSLDDLKAEYIDIYTTFVKAIKVVKLELIEEFSKFLDSTSNS